MLTLLTNACSRSILEAFHLVWNLSIFDNRHTIVMFSCCFNVLVNFGQDFCIILDAFVDFEYSLFIVNVIKCYLMAYLCGTPSIYESSCKTLQLCQWLSLWGVLQRYLSVSCYDHVIYNFYYFTRVSLGKTLLLTRFNKCIFYMLFFWLVNLSKFFIMF